MKKFIVFAIAFGNVITCSIRIWREIHIATALSYQKRYIYFWTDAARDAIEWLLLHNGFESWIHFYATLCVLLGPYRRRPPHALLILPNPNTKPNAYTSKTWCESCDICFSQRSLTAQCNVFRYAFVPGILHSSSRSPIQATHSHTIFYRHLHRGCCHTKNRKFKNPSKTNLVIHVS